MVTTLRGWVWRCVLQMRPFRSSWQQCRSRVSPFEVGTNSFAACFWVSCDTVGFYHCVLGKSLFLFCGCFCWALAAFAVCFAVLGMVRRKCGWGICVLPFFVRLVCGLVVMICHISCDHLCPCWSFFNSFFSCKDRAWERNRPHQRKKTLMHLKQWIPISPVATTPGGRQELSGWKKMVICGWDPRNMVASLSAAPAISLSVGSSGVSGIGRHQDSSASASASVSASVVSRSSSDE